MFELQLIHIPWDYQNNIIWTDFFMKSYCNIIILYNYCKQEGCTPLLEAARWHREACVDLLLSHGAEFNAKDTVSIIQLSTHQRIFCLYNYLVWRHAFAFSCYWEYLSSQKFSIVNILWSYSKCNEPGKQLRHVHWIE